MGATEGEVSKVLLTWREAIIEATANATEALIDLGLDPEPYLLDRAPVGAERDAGRSLANDIAALNRLARESLE